VNKVYFPNGESHATQQEQNQTASEPTERDAIAEKEEHQQTGDQGHVTRAEWDRTRPVTIIKAT